MIPFGEFAPDRSIHAQGASTNILNAKPVADGWGPLPGLEIYSEALPAAPQGGFTAVAPDGTLLTIIGTSTNLYTLASDGTFSSVGNSYSLPAGDKWSFARFGTRVIATQLGNPPQYYDIGVSSSFAALPGSPPTARYVSVVGDFVVLSYISGSPTQMRWSGLNDSEEWTVRTAMSDIQTFPDGGEIMGVVAVAQGAYVVQRDTIRSMAFTGGAYVFTFSIVNESRGCIAPHSIAQIGPSDFVYLSEDGFFRGASGTAIGAERVDRTFFLLADVDSIEKTEASTDPFEKVVWFRFLVTEGGSLLYGYDWQLDRWFTSDQSLSSMGVFTTSAVTLEELDALYPSGLDSIPASLDSSIFSGGRPGFSGFDADYKLGFFNGPSQQATLETATIELNPPERSFLQEVQIIGDLGLGEDGSYDDTEIIIDAEEGSNDDYQVQRALVQVGSADYHGRDITWGDSVAPNEYTGIYPFRVSARLHRFRVVVEADKDWSHIIGLRPTAIPEGNR